MPSASNTTTIARPPADVFAFVADGLNAPKWRPGVIDISLTSGSGLGAVYRQGVKGPGGRRIDADYEVTGFEPDRSLSFRAIAGPVRPTGDYRLEAVSQGTRITFSLEAELSGIKKLLMGGAVQKTMDAEVASLGTLKAVLEGRDGAGSPG
ncbi:MAG: SRPBCC family protein [Candidatus Limnocylindrales bacterium]